MTETIAAPQALTLRHKLQPLLSDREELLWTGQPRQGVVFRGYDIFLIPFSLIWGLGMLAGFGAALLDGAPFAMFIPFALMATIAFYLIAGRFLVDMVTRAKTTYGITNRRIIVHQESLFGKTKSYDLKTLTNLSLEQGRDGRGTVTIGAAHPRQMVMSGLHFPGVSNYMPPALEQIPDAQRVYEMIQDIRA